MEALLQFNSEAWFQKISIPTLIIEGREDIICPEDSKRLAAGIPGAQLLTLARQAHMPNVENPIELIDAILSFLK